MPALSDFDDICSGRDMPPEEWAQAKRTVRSALESNCYLLENLQMMVNIFNSKEVDPLLAFIAIEKAKAAITRATR